MHPVARQNAFWHEAALTIGGSTASPVGKVFLEICAPTASPKGPRVVAACPQAQSKTFFACHRLRHWWVH